MSKNCCHTEEEFPHYNNTIPSNHQHTHEHGNYRHGGPLTAFLPSIISFIILMIGIFLDYYLKPTWFSGIARFIWYLFSYLFVALPVIKEAIKSILKKDIFSEFFLMTLATVGAFCIGEYPEGVAVMLFYSIGEIFQDLAVSRAKTNIKTLLDQRPDEVTVIRDGVPHIIKAKNVKIGEVIQLKPGEKLALDGILQTEKSSFNTAALTGESKPATKINGDHILAGMINIEKVSEVQVTTKYEDSKLSKILELVQSATSQKSPTELFIRKFARIYTPIVVLLAILIISIPYFFISDYVFSEWLYKALVFLVISCPCALVISIPLGYFGGISAASRNGILFKGSNFLDLMAEVKTIAVDKTGTITQGVFKVQEVHINSTISKETLLEWVNFLESKSTHPIATAIHNYVGPINYRLKLENIEEISGLGLRARAEGKELLVGNFRLLDSFQIKYNLDLHSIVETVVAIAYDKQFVGYITISDELKESAKQSIYQLHQLDVKITMLSGDKNAVVQKVANKVGIETAFGDLLPEDKVNKMKEIKAKNQAIAFVGDGFNDAPVIALSDVGIAMGGLGSDATIETADVVIQDDDLAKLPMAIKISKETKKIVWQNITLAFGVKALVLSLGTFGIANMWEAVFADVGVALLAILNAVRIQKIDFHNI